MGHVLRAAVVVLVGLGLVGCAPQATQEAGKVSLTVAASKSTFYPHELGLTWNYLTESDRLDASPYRLGVEGITLFGTAETIRFSWTGRGVERGYYRTFTDKGVFLHGMTVPGASITLVPPLQEYPAQNELRLGATWGGQSQLTLMDNNKTRESLPVQYKYTVLEQRNVKLNTSNRSYSVWVINRQIVGAQDILPNSREFFFVPYVGEVLTADGFVLRDTNAGQ